MQKQRLSSYERARTYILSRNAGASKGKAKELSGIHPRMSIKTLQKTEGYKRAEKDLILALRGEGVDEKYIAKRIKAMIDDETYVLSFGKKVKMSKVSSHVGKGLELLAKVRGDFEPLKIQPVDPIRQMSMQELAEALEEAKKEGTLNADFIPTLAKG
jgi:hypothetical protein